MAKEKMKKLYTLGEEITNSITHGIGSLLSIAALVIMVVVAAMHHNTIGVVTSTIFGASLIILYTMSTLYHAITNKKAKKILRLFDHCTIYLLIAGTYTPYTLVALRSIDPTKAWIIFGIVWGIAILGTIFYLVFKNKFKILNVVSYIVMGWVVLIALPEVISYFEINNAMPGLYLLVAGGIAYTVGVIFYALHNLNLRYFHSIWHLFVLGGSICHFLSVTLYII
ncbi:MAG: hemolysin III family protein [Clostridia bacterium]|nr:hemolysin III family protein [Clostridia bacterium]